MRTTELAFFVIALTAGACAQGLAADDGQPALPGTTPAATDDASSPPVSSGTPPAGNGPDAATDSGGDASTPDSTPDSSPPADTGAPDSSPQPDGATSAACANGSGTAAFRFHFDSSNLATPVMEAFGLASHTGWNLAVDGQFIDGANGGGVEVTDEAGNKRILIQFPANLVTGITKATMYVRARSYSTSADASVRVYASRGSSAQLLTNSVKHAAYAWYSLDVKGAVPGDVTGTDPVTLSLYALGDANELSVAGVELCVE